MRRTRIRWMIGAVVGAVTLAALGSALAGAQGDDSPRGTDPLSAEELEAAVDAAGSPVPAAVDPPPGQAAAESAGANGLPDRVVLLVERHEEPKGDETAGLRRADVWEYSYADDTLHRSVVDLSDGSVDDTTSGQGTQLPLVAVETDRAVELLFADAAFADLLAAEFENATGRVLRDPSNDLDVEPIVFRADAMPTVAQGAATACGIQRCAQFLIQTADHVLINVFPLVNLSEGVVIDTDGVSGR